jgi:hypothetical protein
MLLPLLSSLQRHLPDMPGHTPLRFTDEQRLCRSYKPERPRKGEENQESGNDSVRALSTLPSSLGDHTQL